MKTIHVDTVKPNGWCGVICFVFRGVGGCDETKMSHKTHKS